MEDFVSQLVALSKGIWKYRFWSIAAAWLALITGSILVYALHDQYHSSARVYVDTQSILKPLLAGMTTMPNVDQQVSIMSRTLLTRPNVEKVIRSVDLDLNAKTVRDHEALVDDLLTNIKIAGTPQNDIYTISYTNNNARIVKDVVQAFLTIFLEGNYSDKRQDSAKAVRFINDQIKTYEGKLAAAEAALKEFKVANMGMLPKTGSDYGSKVADATDQLNQARLDLREAEQARDAIRREINGIPNGAKIESNGLPRVMSETDTRILALKKNLDNLRMQYTEEHPDIVSAKRLIAQLETSKAAETPAQRAASSDNTGYSPVLQQLTINLATAEARVGSMRARVNEFATRAAQLREMNAAAPAVEQQLAQLNRDYTVNKENYEKLVASRESAKLSGELSATTDMITFRVIDPPTVPLLPTGPNRVIYISVVFIAALALGTLVGILMSKARPTFLTVHSLRELTGLPTLGSVGMNWTPAEETRRRKTVMTCSMLLGALVLTYAAMLTHLVLK